MRESAAVEEQARGPGLMPRRRAHAVARGELGEECLDRADAERRRVPVARVVREAADPRDVCGLGAPAVVADPDRRAELREPSRW